MARSVIVAAAQFGPIQRAEPQPIRPWLRGTTSPGVPQPCGDPGRRLPERHLRRGHREGRREHGCELFGHSIIVNPQGEILAQATSLGDELITTDCDLDRCTLGRITGQVGAVAPPEWEPGPATK